VHYFAVKDALQRGIGAYVGAANGILMEEGGGLSGVLRPGAGSGSSRLWSAGVHAVPKPENELDPRPEDRKEEEEKYQPFN
jgi:hypothetical protein